MSGAGSGVAQRDHRAAVGSRRGSFWGRGAGSFGGSFWGVFGVFFWGVFLGRFLVLGCFWALIPKKFFFRFAIQIKGKVGVSDGGWVNNGLTFIFSTL